MPDLFSEINSGVLLWKRSRKQRALVRRWLSLYDQLQASSGQAWDQASLRSVLVVVYAKQAISFNAASC